MIQYCPNCGTKITAESRFCPGCGSALTSNEGARGTQRGPGNTTGNRSVYYPGNTRRSNSGDVGSIIIRVVSGILGVAFLIQGILLFFNGLRGYGYLFNTFRWNYYYGVFGAIFTFILQLLSPIQGLAVILFALLLGVTAWKYTEDHIDEYTATLSLGAVVPIAVYLILLLLRLLSGRFYFFPMLFVKYVLFPALAVLLMFILFTVFVQRPFISKSQKEVQNTFGNVIGFLCEQLQFLPQPRPNTRRTADTRRQNTGYTAADYFANQENNGSQTAGAADNYGGGQGYNDNTQLRLAEPLPTDRSIWKTILFNLLTCGFYSYYFIYSLARDVNICCEGDNESTPGLLAYFFLGIITCGIYDLYWMYKLGNRLQKNAPRHGVVFTENGTSVLLWELFGSILCGIGYFIALNILIKNTNTLCEFYNQENAIY